MMGILLGGKIRKMSHMVREASQTPYYENTQKEGNMRISNISGQFFLSILYIIKAMDCCGVGVGIQVLVLILSQT